MGSQRDVDSDSQAPELGSISECSPSMSSSWELQQLSQAEGFFWQQPSSEFTPETTWKC